MSSVLLHYNADITVVVPKVTFLLGQAAAGEPVVDFDHSKGKGLNPPHLPQS